MEIAYLVLHYIQVLIWPVSLLIGLFLFRKPLTAVFHRLKGADLPGGVSLDFNQEMRDAEALSLEVAKVPRKKTGAATPTLPITQANAKMISLGLQPTMSGLNMSHFTELAQQDPNLALAGLRMEIEIIARNLAKGFSVDIPPRDSAGLLDRLLEAGAITTNQYLLIRKVIKLCNAAVHGTRVSKEHADTVIDITGPLVKDYLEWLSWGFDDEWKLPE